MTDRAPLDTPEWILMGRSPRVVPVEVQAALAAG